MTNENRTHRVQSGDSLWKIAANFKREHSDNRSIQDIITQIRELNRDHIGQNDRILANRNITLNLPNPQTGTAPAPSTPRAAPVSPRPSQAGSPGGSGGESGAEARADSGTGGSGSARPAQSRATSVTPRPTVTRTENQFTIRRVNGRDGPEYDTVSTIAAAWVQANPDKVGRGLQFANVAAVQSEILRLNGLNIRNGVAHCGEVIDGVVYLNPGTIYLPNGNRVLPQNVELVRGRDCGQHRECSPEQRRAMVTTPVTAIFNPRTGRETNGRFPYRPENGAGDPVAQPIGGLNSFILWFAPPANRVAPDGPGVWGPGAREANGVRTTAPGGRVNGDLISTNGQETTYSVENGGFAEGTRPRGDNLLLASSVGPRLIRQADGRDVAVGADFYRTIDRDVVLNSVYRSWLPIGGTMWREGFTGQAVFANVGRTAEGVDALNRLQANYRAMDILHAQLPARLHVNAPAASPGAQRLTEAELDTARRFFRLSLQNLGNPIVWSNEQPDGLPGWDSVTSELRAFMGRIPLQNRGEFQKLYQDLGLGTGVRNPNEFMRRARRAGVLEENPYEVFIAERANEPHVQQGLRITEELGNAQSRAYWEQRLGARVNERLDAPETSAYVQQEGRDRAREGLMRQEVTMALLRADAEKRMANTLRGATDQERIAATGITRVPNGDVAAAQAATNVGSMRHLLGVIGDNHQITSAAVHLMANTPGGLEALMRVGHLATAVRNGVFDRDGDKQAKAMGGFATRAQAVATMRQLEKDLGMPEGHFTHDRPNLFEQGRDGLWRFITAGFVRTNATLNAGDNQEERYQAQMREILSRPDDPRYARLMAYAGQMYRAAATAEDGRPAAALATFLAPSIHTDRSPNARNSERYPLAVHYQNMLVEIAGVSRHQNQPHSFQSVAQVRAAAEVQEAINNNNFTARAAAQVHERLNDAGDGVRSRNVRATRPAIEAVIAAGGEVPAASAAGRALAQRGVQVNVVTAAGQRPEVTHALQAIAALPEADRAAMFNGRGRIDVNNPRQMAVLGDMLAALHAGSADRNVSRTQYDALLGTQAAQLTRPVYVSVIVDALTSQDAATREATRTSLQHFAEGGQGHRELAQNLLSLGAHLPRGANQREQIQSELASILHSSASAGAIADLSYHLSTTTGGHFNQVLSGRVGLLGQNGGQQITKALNELPAPQRQLVADSLLALARGHQTPDQATTALGRLQGQMHALLSHSGASYVEIAKWIALSVAVASALGGGGGGGGGTPLSPFRPEDPTKPTTWPIPNPSGPPDLPALPGGGFRPR